MIGEKRNRKLGEAFLLQFFSFFSSIVMQVTSHHPQCPHVQFTHKNVGVVYLYQTVCVLYLIRLVFMVYLIRCVVPDVVYNLCYQTASVIQLIRLVCMVHLIRPYVWYRISYEAVCMVYLIRLHM